MNLPEDFVFSPSSLQDYVDCPRRFQLKYLQRQRWPAAEVDEMLEFEKRMEQGQRFHQLVHQHLLGIPADTLTKHISDESVRQWFETYLKNGLTDMPKTRFPERTLTIPLGKYALLAKFDVVAIGDKAIIIDWKTSRKIPRREWLAKKLQTIVYRYVLAKGGSHLNKGQTIEPEQIEMRYWYAEHDGATLSFTYDKEQFATHEANLLHLVDEIDSRPDFPLTEDMPRCRFCTYRSLCDRGTQAGSLVDWDTMDTDDVDLADFEIDIDQIAEIEF
ncbi:MAG: PD-(D/E)XK nuclease family protein [Anaerolineae bacterium]|nr:PD-(D/E)XK nuclease family protein [Anaerolineae bacterium]MDQ7036113.1 PD-(D/E)XK nuclease family protein [Anaerolineae bacterium]